MLAKHKRAGLQANILKGLALCLALASQSLPAQEHFNAKGNDASAATRALQESLRQSLPFDDERDFEEARRGFIAEPASRQILGANGNVV